MSFYDRSLTHLRCPDCNQTRPLYTKLIYNPEAMAIVIEDFALEHEVCGTFKHQTETMADYWRRRFLEVTN